jgi:hypothetical protein
MIVKPCESVRVGTFRKSPDLFLKTAYFLEKFMAGVVSFHVASDNAKKNPSVAKGWIHAPDNVLSGETPHLR